MTVILIGGIILLAYLNLFFVVFLYWNWIKKRCCKNILFLGEGLKKI